MHINNIFQELQKLINEEDNLDPRLSAIPADFLQWPKVTVEINKNNMNGKAHNYHIILSVNVKKHSKCFETLN